MPRGWNFVQELVSGEAPPAVSQSTAVAVAAPRPTVESTAAIPLPEKGEAGPALAAVMAVDHGLEAGVDGNGGTGTESAFTNDGSDVIAREVAVSKTAPPTATPEAEVRSDRVVVEEVACCTPGPTNMCGVGRFEKHT
jgi:hypothetical protein